MNLQSSGENKYKQVNKTSSMLLSIILQIIFLDKIVNLFTQFSGINVTYFFTTALRHM